MKRDRLRTRIGRGAARCAALALMISARSLVAAPPPEDSEDYFAIRCVAVEGPDHAQVAESHAKTLKKIRGLKSSLIRIESTKNGSVVYYGRSTRVFDVQTGVASFKPDLSAELKAIREYVGPQPGQRPFVLAVMDSLPPPPTRFPAWDLSSIQEGYWSLQVAAFYNTEGMTRRRQAAEEYCKLLRDQGEQAYFHHGATVSSVCVGLFPQTAIRTTKTAMPRSREQSVKSEIIDPKLIELQKKFPHNTENGHTIYDLKRDPATGEVLQRTAKESFVVKVPNAVEWKPALRPKSAP